jgi:hypothetical protein
MRLRCPFRQGAREIAGVAGSSSELSAQARCGHSSAVERAVLSLPGDEIMADLDSSLFSRRSAEAPRLRREPPKCGPAIAEPTANRTRRFGQRVSAVSWASSLLRQQESP